MLTVFVLDITPPAIVPSTASELSDFQTPQNACQASAPVSDAITVSLSVVVARVVLAEVAREGTRAVGADRRGSLCGATTRDEDAPRPSTLKTATASRSTCACSATPIRAGYAGWAYCT